MRLVVCHYHLNRGGVSRVIENHLRLLVTLEETLRPTSVVVAFGGRATDWDFRVGEQLPFDLEFVEVNSLEYDSERSAGDGELLSELQDLLKTHQCDTESTVLHAHNHCLGKNAAFPGTLVSLAEEGWRILLQLHDFAEDLRPQNYVHMLENAGGVDSLHAKLYPQAEHVHYATLNARDFEMLASAGIQSERLHKLPNPVVPLRNADAAAAEHEYRNAARQKLASNCGVALEEDYILYPVRGIQRKNLGELLLWASVCDATFAVTLPPLNPREVKYYESWKVIAEELSLKVLFEVGEQLSLGENYAAADAIITTSVAEGFGLVFLEAALMNRPLVGRNLPGITDDFLASGIQFPGLVDSMEIPTQVLDIERLKQAYIEQSRELRNAFRVPQADNDELAVEVDSLFTQDAFDFGRLDSEAQKHVLRSIHEQPALRQAVRDLNPVFELVGQLSSACDSGAIEENRYEIERHYSLRTIGHQLQSIYGTLLECQTSTVKSRPDIASKLQEAFLRPNQLHLLRLET